MINFDAKLKGKITFDSIEFSEVLTKTAKKANDTSCKVYVPREYENKEVIIILPKVKKTRRKR